MNNTQLLFKADNVSKLFTVGTWLHRTQIAAVNNVTLSCSTEKPEIITVAGESGSGKTTLARMMLRMLEPSNGTIYFRDRDINQQRGWDSQMKFMSEVQPVFQNPFETFSPLKRVEDYLRETVINFKKAKKKPDVDNKMDEALRSVGLSLQEVRGRYPHQLSGGQLQRVSVARALIPNPSLLIADEPVSMVDASLRMSIVNLFQELKNEYDVSIVYITHDLATAYYISDRIAIMLRGSVVESGDVEKVLGSPLHPYSKLLRDSVPLPSKDPNWTKKIELSVTETKEYSRKGCKFTGRCPKVMDRCWEQEPPDFDTDGRLVRCYLYDDKPNEPSQSA